MTLIRTEQPNAPSRSVARAVSEGLLSGRVWLYANYHCNLACAYCLTESAPTVPAREIGPERMREVAAEAAEAGFTALGVTGGEPFLLHYLPELVAEMAAILPVVVLTNGTLFTRSRLDRVGALAGLPVHVQISLDHPDPVANDAMRGPENFRKVVEAIPRLVERGVGVRIATTADDPDPRDMERLCALHRSLGVADEDHVTRPIVRRGRAKTRGMGRAVGPMDLDPELTISVDGAFWSPFGPTVTGGRLDTDLRITRTTRPLSIPAEAMVRVAATRPRQGGRVGFR